MLPALYPDLTWSDFWAFINVFQRSKQPFAEALENKFQSRHALTFSSGRAGLYNILKAHGIEDKSVLITAYSCCVVSEAIVQSGNRPVFMDLGGESFNARITQEAAEEIPDLKAIVVTNLYGISDFSDLSGLQKGGDVLLILDDALSPQHVARRRKDLYDYVTISCGVRKPFSCLGGGVVFTDEEKHYELLSTYVGSKRRPSRYPEKFRKILLSFAFFIAFHPAVYPMTALFRHRTRLLDSFFSERHNDLAKDCPDYFEDMQPFQKRIGLNQLKKIDTLWEKRKQVGNMYANMLEKDYEWVRTYWRRDTPYSHVPFLHPVRDRLHQFLLQNRIETEKYFDYVIPEIEAYDDKGHFPHAQALARRMINLPIHVRMNEAAVKRVVDAIRQFETENHERVKP